MCKPHCRRPWRQTLGLCKQPKKVASVKLASHRQSSQISETLQCQLHSQNDRDPHDTCYTKQTEYFDIEGILRARRLDGKTLRTTISSLAREVLVSRAESNIATKHCQEGSIMMDVPPHTTMHQLMALAEDKSGWMECVREIHSPESRESSYTRRSVDQ
jgi:hypothetical protein